MCEAMDLLVHFGVDVISMCLFVPCLGSLGSSVRIVYLLHEACSFVDHHMVNVHRIGVLLFGKTELLLCKRRTKGVRRFIISFLKKALSPFVSNVKVCGFGVPLFQCLQWVFRSNDRALQAPG
jgi:hypothetical protein